MVQEGYNGTRFRMMDSEVRLMADMFSLQVPRHTLSLRELYISHSAMFGLKRQWSVRRRVREARPSSTRLVKLVFC